MRERLLRQLLAQMRCMACGQRYQRDGIHVLDQRDDRWLLQVSCASCSNRGIVAAVVKESTAPDAQDRRDVVEDHGPVSMDDVLDMHNFLKDYMGDLLRLLAPH